MRVYQFHHIRVAGTGQAGTVKDYTHRNGAPRHPNRGDDPRPGPAGGRL